MEPGVFSWGRSQQDYLWPWPPPSSTPKCSASKLVRGLSENWESLLRGSILGLFSMWEILIHVQKTAGGQNCWEAFQEIYQNFAGVIHPGGGTEGTPPSVRRRRRKRSNWTQPSRWGKAIKIKSWVSITYILLAPSQCSSANIIGETFPWLTDAFLPFWPN